MSIRNILVVVSCLISIIIGATLARGRGGGATASGPLKIGLSLDTLKEARWQADRDLFVARCKELGADVFDQSANSDDTRQINDCESLLTQNINVLVIVPH